MQPRQSSDRYVDQIPTMRSFDQILFMRPVLDAIARPAFFRRAFAIGLRVIAVLLVIGAFVSWLNNWRFVSSLPGAAILGGIIFQVLFAIAVYMVAHTLFIRASNITDLPEADFVVIPIFSLLLRLIGEVYAIFFAVIGVAGCLGLWFAGWALYGLLGSAPLPPGMGGLLMFGRGGETFVAGLLLLAAALISGFFVLVFFYMLAELIGVTANIAHNMKVTRDILERNSRV